MSAAGRGAERRESDYYPTPAWAVHALLREVQLPTGRWLEPCVGDGAIVRAVEEYYATATTGTPEQRQPGARAWTTCDTRAVGAHFTCDFLSLPPPHEPYDVCITNPPFSLAMPILKAALQQAQRTFFLLRTAITETEDRSEFLRTTTPNEYKLSKRPSFTGGGTDMSNYSWWEWPGQGRYVVLQHPNRWRP